MQHPIHALILLATGLAPLSTLPGQSLMTYGAGTPGTGNRTPRIWNASTPRPGNQRYAITIDRGRPNSPAVAFVSTGKGSLNLGGVQVLIDFATSLQLPFTTLDSDGQGEYRLPIPNNSSSLGVHVFQQAFVVDPGGAPLGFAATAGLDVEVTGYGLLVGTRSTGRTTNSLIAINLDTNTQTTISHPSQTNSDIPGLYPKGRTHLMVGSGRTNRVTMYDCRVFPPRYVTDFAASGTPWAVTWHPDGVRTYIVNQGTPSVQVVWGLPGAANLGQPYPGGDIAITERDALRMAFVQGGDVGVLSVLGLFSNGGEIRTYDTKTGSSTYHRVLKRFRVPGEYLFDAEPVDDTTFAIASARLGGQFNLRLVDLTTMRQTQAYGGSGNFGRVSRGMVAGPRGRYVYVGNPPSAAGNTGGVLRVNIDRSDPNFGQVADINAGLPTTWGPYDVEISDAGDRLYAIVGAGIQTSFQGAIIEWDTATLREVRRWPLNGLGNLYNLAHR